MCSDDISGVPVVIDAEIAHHHGIRLHLSNKSGLSGERCLLLIAASLQIMIWAASCGNEKLQEDQEMVRVVLVLELFFPPRPQSLDRLVAGTV